MVIESYAAICGNTMTEIKFGIPAAEALRDNLDARGRRSRHHAACKDRALDRGDGYRFKLIGTVRLAAGPFDAMKGQLTSASLIVDGAATKMKEWPDLERMVWHNHAADPCPPYRADTCRTNGSA